MYKLAFLPIAFLLAACSTSVDSEEKRSLPASCDSSSRNGAYLMTTTKRSGDCGEMGPVLLMVYEDQKYAEGCEVHVSKYSKNNCRLDTDVTCPETYHDPSSWGGKSSALVRTTGYTEQVTEDGSRLEGLITLRVESDSGACLGTYDVVYVRQ